MSQADDEYIDYSCSTPLERLARDIETVLRSWHVSQNDRHVSFSSPSNDLLKENMTSQGSIAHTSTLSSRRSLHSSARARIKSRMNSSDENHRASGVILIRSKEIIMSTFERETVHLCLSLWDSPSTSDTAVDSSSSASSSSSLPLSLQANWKTVSPSAQPLTSLKSFCFSDLSSLFGIGQHIVLTTTQTKDLQTFSVDVDMMQMALNIATQNSYCRIPAFALPSEYHPLTGQTTSNNSRYNRDATNMFNGPPPLMNIPTWLVPNEIVNSTNMDAWTTSMGEQFQSSFSKNKHGARPASRFAGLFGKSSNSAKLKTISTALIPYDIDDPDNPDNQPWKKREFFKSIFKGYCNPGPHFQDAGASFVLEYIPSYIPAHLQTVEDLRRLLRHLCQVQYQSEKDGHGTIVDPSVVLSSYHLHSPSDNASNHSQSQSSSFFSSSHYNYHAQDTHSSIPEDAHPQNTRHKDKILLEYVSYKYEWNKKNILTRQASLTTIYDQNDYYNPYEWRESCMPNTSIELHIEEVFDRQDSYYSQCMHHAMMLLRATHVSQKMTQEERVEPMWGPSLDPLASIHVSLSWIRPNPPTPSQNTTTTSRLFSPRPSHLDNEDASEHNHSLGSNKKEPPLFSPTQNPPSSFFSKCYWDRSLPCHTLSASTRCTLAAYLRSSILHRDLLLCQLSNISVLQELSQPDDLEDIDDDDPNDHRKMDGVGMEARAMELSNSALGNVVTKKLVKAMDFRDAVKDLPSRDEMEDRVKSIFDGKIFPTWQEWSVQDVEDQDSDEDEDEYIDEGMKVEDSCGKKDFLGLSSLNCAAPPGRLVSLLSLHMAQMQTPARMAALWQVFLEELRIRWEMRETLPSLHPIKGFDFFKDSSRSNMTLGVRLKANFAAFNHNTEPDPHQNYCLISQKLQVFNIGVETQLAAEEVWYNEQERLREEDESKLNESQRTFVDDDDTVPPSECYASTTTVSDTHLLDIHSPEHRKDVGDNDSLDEIKSSQSNSDDEFFDTMEESNELDEDGDMDLDEKNVSHFIPQSPNREESIGVIQRQQRHGARCPVNHVNLIASGDQLFAPYLQRPLPLTEDVLMQRKMMMKRQGSLTQDRILIAQRIQKPKLLSDMKAFKAANPGAVFQDFINWYGNPGSPFDGVLDEDDYIDDNATLFTARTSRTGSTGRISTESTEEMHDAIELLTSTRTFWSDTWDEAEPKPAAEQQPPLFDPLQEVEMVLNYFETMHPAHLLNQILSVNFTNANFILRATAGEALHVKTVRFALDRLEERTKLALEKLQKSLHVSMFDDEEFTTNDTLSACEAVCDAIGDVEVLLARATSLLHKFPGDYDMVQKLLRKRDGEEISIQSLKGRSGILKTIWRHQKPRALGDEKVWERSKTSKGVTYYPDPMVQEYILRNSHSENPFQLSAVMRENGSNYGTQKKGYSKDGSILLAMKRCERE